MRRDVQEIFRTTPHHKQVMMFSATLAKEIRATCKKFMANVCLAVCKNPPLPFADLPFLQPLEIFVDDETKLTLHGLQQHFVKMDEVGKNRKLNELLDTLEFNQVRPEPDSLPPSERRRIGCHLREVRRARDRIGQATCFLQLPEYQYPLGSFSGGAVCLNYIPSRGTLT